MNILREFIKFIIWIIIWVIGCEGIVLTHNNPIASLHWIIGFIITGFIGIPTYLYTKDLLDKLIKND